MFCWCWQTQASHPICHFKGSRRALQADGGTRCAAINAALLALADAGVPLRDMVAACAAGYLDKTPILDMNYLEDAGGGPDVVVGAHMSSGVIVLLQVGREDCLLPPHLAAWARDTFMKICTVVSLMGYRFGVMVSGSRPAWNACAATGNCLETAFW